MFVRLTQFTLPAGEAAKIIRRYYDEIAPVIRQQPGLLYVQLLEPVAEGEPYLSYTAWQNEAATKAFEASEAYPAVFTIIRNAAASAPVQRYYNVQED